MKYLIFNSLAALGLLSGGYLIGKTLNHKKIVYAGNLRIDESEKNEPPRLFLELTCDLNDISKSQVVNLKVIKENYVKREKNSG